jgi:hypothetical protein
MQRYVREKGPPMNDPRYLGLGRIASRGVLASATCCIISAQNIINLPSLFLRIVESPHQQGNGRGFQPVTDTTLRGPYLGQLEISWYFRHAVVNCSIFPTHSELRIMLRSVRTDIRARPRPSTICSKVLYIIVGADHK